jgi:hypothetical protein
LVHAVQDRYLDVDVVVELDVVLAISLAEEPSDVLHDPSLESQREGQEQGLERGPVEALTEVGTGGDHNDAVLAALAAVGVVVGIQGVGHGASGLPAQATA